MNQIFDKRLIAGIALVVALLVINAGLSYQNIQQLRENGDLVVRTHVMLGAVNEIVSTMKDAETGQRGYLITGKPSYLEPYTTAVGDVEKKIENVKSLTAGNPRQQGNILKLQSLIKAKLGELERTIALRKTDPEAARQEVMTDEGKKEMDAIRLQVSEMERQEQDVLRQRDEQSSRAYQVAVATSVLAGITSLFLFGCFVYLVRRNLLERVKSAGILFEQREWFRTTLASIGDAVIATDTTGRVTFLNAVAQTLTGWKEEEASGVSLETIFKIVNEETRQTVENPAFRALKEGTIVGLANHTVLISKEGVERPIDDSASPIRNESGKIAGAVLVFHDVTERRRTEEALQQQTSRLHAEKEMLRVTFASIGDAVMATDIEGRVTFLNPVAQTLTGWTQESARGISSDQVFNIINESTREPAENPVLRALREGQIIGLANHTLLIARDGTERPIDDSAGPILDDKGNIAGAVLVFRDVTARREAEVERQRFMAIVESSNDAIISKDLNGIIMTWNKGAEAIFGYSADEIIGKPVSALAPSEKRDEMPRIIDQIKRGARVEHYDTTRRRKDGTEIAISLTVSPIRDATGKIVGASKIAREVTERIRLQRVLEDRTTQLAEADRLKNEFLAMLAHELRNPLAPIRNALHLIQMQQNQNESLRHPCEIIERQVGAMVRLVDDLLDVSRITRGKIRLQTEQVDVVVFVTRAIESSRPLIDRRRHQLELSLTGEPMLVEADVTRMAQVVMNLLNNSAKYTLEGGHITVKVEEDKGHAVIRVKDNGVGIPPDMLPRVFELFTQAERTLDRAEGGLGIGLTLVRQMTEMHGGTVEAYSGGLGQGSEFKVRLPLVAENAAAVDPSKKMDDGQRIKSAVRRRVLVVDDNRDSADSMAILLRLAGHETRTVHDGKEALAEVEAYRPDLVLLDIGLPGMDGYTVARQMRSRPEFANMVVVALTGYGGEEDRRRSQEAGFDRHMLKPVEFDALNALLQELPDR